MAQILIVDDDADSVRIMSKAVRVLGHEPVCANGGQEALEILVTGVPDAVFLDLMMPGMDGFETLSRIRALPHVNGLPVLIVTAGGEAKLEQRALTCGAKGVMHKPIELTTIADWIDCNTRQN